MARVSNPKVAYQLRKGALDDYPSTMPTRMRVCSISEMNLPGHPYASETDNSTTVLTSTNDVAVEDDKWKSLYGQERVK